MEYPESEWYGGGTIEELTARVQRRSDAETLFLTGEAWSYPVAYHADSGSWYMVDAGTLLQAPALAATGLPDTEYDHCGEMIAWAEVIAGLGAAETPEEDRAWLDWVNETFGTSYTFRDFPGR
jgi:hypothetical protein